MQEENMQQENKQPSVKSLFLFIFFSILGFVLFLVPINLGGESKVFISQFTDFVTTNLYTPFIIFTQLCALMVLVCSIVFSFYTSKSEYINNLFKSTPINIVTRILGSFLYLVVLNNLFAGNVIFDAILDPNTGGTMAGKGGLLTTLYLTFFIGILILPLLTHFGAVEYIGTLIAPFMEKVFKVPGYSAVDAIASFVGDGTIGIVVTDTQYRRGYYSKRQAYIIATSFSIVGISFATSIAEELGFGSIFPIFYLTIALSVIIMAMITARLKLSKYPDEYYEGIEPKNHPKAEGVSTHKHALNLALNQAENVNVSTLLKDTFTTILNCYIGFLPVIMLVGTLALVVAEKTNIFNIISYPLVPLYDLLGFSTETAKAMAPATIVGFADMYLPALFIGGTDSEAARFFVAVLSFTQLVFMSETGMVLLKTKIGLNFFDVVKVFLFRTVLSIPIVLCFTYLLAFLGIITM